MKKSYPIERLEIADSVVYIPKDFKFNQCKQIAFGSISTEVTFRHHESNKRKISIGKGVWKKLQIPDLPLKLHLFEKDSTIYLGPIVGIFTAGFTSYPHSPIGTRSYVFSKLLGLFDKAGVLPVVFGVQHIDWESGLVDGYFYYKSEWQRIKIPMPNVIYDRLPNRKVENLRMMQDLKVKLAKEYVIPWFNPGFFNKADIYKILNINTQTSPYIPKYTAYTTMKELKKMLEQFNSVYVKPNNGSLGHGIYQITNINDGFLCRYRDQDEVNRLLKFPSIERLDTFLQKEKKDDVYIIQEGIPLMEVENRFADFRVHTNKNLEGKWMVSVIGCKIAARGSATTHLISGGTIQSIDEVFAEEKRENVINHLKSAVIRISEELDNRMNGQLAEIGFDMGMDEQGKIWMFEANSKPGRAIFKHPKLRKFERLTQMLVLNYAVHLSELVIKYPERFFHEPVLR